MFSWATFAGVWVFSFLASAFFHVAFSVVLPVARGLFFEDAVWRVPSGLETEPVADELTHSKAAEPSQDWQVGHGSRRPASARAVTIHIVNREILRNGLTVGASKHPKQTRRLADLEPESLIDLNGRQNQKRAGKKLQRLVMATGRGAGHIDRPQFRTVAEQAHPRPVAGSGGEDLPWVENPAVGTVSQQPQTATGGVAAGESNQETSHKQGVVHEQTQSMVADSLQSSPSAASLAQACPRLMDSSWVDEFHEFGFFPRSYHALIRLAAGSEDHALDAPVQPRFELLEFYPESAKPAQFIDQKLAQFFLSCLNDGVFAERKLGTAPFENMLSSSNGTREFLHKMRVTYMRTGVVLH